MSSATFTDAPLRLRQSPVAQRFASPSSGLLAAFVREERFGIRLAVYARLAALLVIAIWVTVQNWSSGGTVVGYYLGLIGAFAALGIGHLALSESRHRRAWHKFAFTTLELALLVFVIVRFPPGVSGIPPAMLLRWNNEAYFYVLLVGTALTFSPLLVLWFGLAASLLWTGGMLSINLQPASFGFDRIGASSELPSIWMPTVLDPNYINANGFITQVVTLLVASATLSIAVWRARLLVCRQTEVERERTNLARYFSPNMIDSLAKADEPLGAVRSQSAGVLFADVVGFTRLSESLTPEQTMALLRDFHRRMVEVVFAHGGTLDKFIGDEVMATFGTPSPGVRDAASTLACARAMQDAIAGWNRERRQSGAPAIRIGIGAHYGPVVLGDIGGERRFEFAVIGDTVNVASRLERLTRDLDVGVVASDFLVHAARRELGSTAVETLRGLQATPGQALRGRRETIDVWSLPRGELG